MLDAGPAVKITIHLNEDIGAQDDYLHNAILNFLYENHVSGATMFRPHAGFGVHHQLHTHGNAWNEGEHLPVRIEFIENRSKLEALLPRLCEILTDGMIEAQETEILKVVKPANGSKKDQPQGKVNRRHNEIG